MFFSRKKPARSYDPATQQPALRCSICTGAACLPCRWGTLFALRHGRVGEAHER